MCQHAFIVFGVGKYLLNTVIYIYTHVHICGYGELTMRQVSNRE